MISTRTNLPDTAILKQVDNFGFLVYCNTPFLELQYNISAEIDWSLQTQTFSNYIEKQPRHIKQLSGILQWLGCREKGLFCSGVPYRYTSDKIPRTLQWSSNPCGIMQSRID
eukprot:780420-Ditylum_brightwellii.AAC.1